MPYVTLFLSLLQHPLPVWNCVEVDGLRCSVVHLTFFFNLEAPFLGTQSVICASAMIRSMSLASTACERLIAACIGNSIENVHCTSRYRGQQSFFHLSLRQVGNACDFVEAASYHKTVEFSVEPTTKPTNSRTSAQQLFFLEKKRYFRYKVILIT